MFKKKSFHVGLIIILLALILLAFELTLTQTAADIVRVACVGDSITERSGYPFKLQMMLGSGYVVANFGVSGSTVVQNSTIPYMSQPEFERAKNFHPDIVIIMLGTNDANPEISHSEETFETDYSQLISSFQQLVGKQMIWVVKSPPIFSNNSAYDNKILTNTVIPHIENVASQFNLPEVDMYDTLANHTEYFADGVHPNDNGASVIASTLYDAITLPDGSPDTTYFNEDYSG